MFLYFLYIYIYFYKDLSVERYDKDLFRVIFYDFIMNFDLKIYEISLIFF